jgi:cytochrome P450
MKKEMEKVAALHRRRKEGSIEATAPPRSIIDHLMGHNYPSEEALLSDLWIVIFAGHETSAATLCFALMELAKNPSVKNKLRSELAAFMPDQPSLIDLSPQESSNLLSTIANCQYLINCIQEGMRLWPAVAGGPLRAIDKDIQYDGMVIPAGSIVNVHFFSMFRSDWISNAETYDPDRWLDTNSQLPQLKEMFIPFSAGKRNCIGQNMAMLQLRVITAYFIRYFDFELIEEPAKEFFLTLKPASMMMKVRKAY